MKRLHFSVLLLALLFLCSCSTPSAVISTPVATVGTGATATGDITTSPAGSAPVKLTLAIPDNPKTEDFETNAMTLQLEKEGGFDLEFNVLASTDYITKLNLMVTAGISELPDVLITKGVEDLMVYQWAQAGAIIPLTDYFADPSISVCIHEAVERTGVDFVPLLKSPDGNIYGIPSFNQSYGNEFPDKLFYYKPWLDTLNKKVPTTTDEFYDLLKLIQSTDLNGNGKQDEIGLSGTFSVNDYIGWFRFLMNAFVSTGDDNYFMVDDGKVNAAYTTDEWKEGLKYIRKLFAEGLIPVETLTQDANQFKAMTDADPTILFSNVWYCTVTNQALEACNQYVGMAPLVGPSGLCIGTYRPSTPTIAYMVTANCKNPEAAFRLGDLLINERYSISQRWGEQGVNWDYYKDIANPGEYAIQYENCDFSIVTYDDNAFWSSADVQNNSWRQTGPFIRQYSIAKGWALAPTAITPFSTLSAKANTLYQEGNYRPKEYISKLVFSSEESDKITEPLATITSYVKESTANFLAGNVDIDTGWNAYLKELDTIGVKTIVSAAQAAYDRAK